MKLAGQQTNKLTKRYHLTFRVGCMRRSRKQVTVDLSPKRTGRVEATAYYTFLSRCYYIVAKEMNRPLSENCRALDLGFDVRLISPISGVEQFPRTHGESDIISGLSSHVETVCLLSKLKSTQHIEVELDMDELDLTDAEKKATYQEIKDYVLEHSGLKVSNLYIAQVKKKCGIIERENYNKPKSEDAKQPQCPPDKEKAIKEALKHFGMI